MSTLHVCPLSALSNSLAQSNAQWMLSLSGPGKPPDRPDQITGGFLALEFNDIAEPRDGLIEPDMSHVEAILNFTDQWNGSGTLLIHCWMGVSRSTAAALIVSAYRDPMQDMKALAQTLRHASPMATPNAKMVALADEKLRLDGSLIEAVSAIGRGVDTFEGIPFNLETVACDET